MSTDFEEERMRLSSESSTDDALVAMDPLDIDDIKFYLNLSTRYKNRINSYSTYMGVGEQVANFAKYVVYGKKISSAQTFPTFVGRGYGAYIHTQF